MKKSLFIFLIGCLLFPVLEIIWQGYTHYSMALAAGICMLLINKICCEKLSSTSYFFKMLISALIITLVEFIVGVVFNKLLLMEVWDYSSLPFNFLGQICLPFTAVWFVLSLPAIFLCKMIALLCQKKNTKSNNNSKIEIYDSV